MADTRPEFLVLENGEKAKLPFAAVEYAARLASLRAVMDQRDIPVVLLTVDAQHRLLFRLSTLRLWSSLRLRRDQRTAARQSRRTSMPASLGGCSIEDNLIYTDWKRDNYWRAVKSIIGTPGRLGIEADHLTLAAERTCREMLGTDDLVDIAPDTMRLRNGQVACRNRAHQGRGTHCGHRRMGDQGGDRRGRPRNRGCNGRGATRWKSRSLTPARMQNIEIPGSGSSQASTLTVRTTLSPAGGLSPAIS